MFFGLWKECKSIGKQDGIIGANREIRRNCGKKEGWKNAGEADWKITRNEPYMNT